MQIKDFHNTTRVLAIDLQVYVVSHQRYSFDKLTLLVSDLDLLYLVSFCVVRGVPLRIERFVFAKLRRLGSVC